GIGHWALGIGHWALGIGHWALVNLPHSPLPHSPLPSSFNVLWQPHRVLHLLPAAVPQYR
ncbi:MAG: hypothetical protein V7K24_00855, partial [Nostoc sp.]